MNTDPRFDVLVRGDGAVGRAAALALARTGLRVALRGRASPAPAPVPGGRAAGDGPDVTAAAGEATADVRAYALNAGSLALLSSLGALERLPPDARTPVHAMAVCGDGGGRLAFDAFDQAERELAVIVDAAALEAALGAAIEAPGSGVVRLGAAEPDPGAALVVHAEGRDAEAQLGADVLGERQPYGQRAIAARVTSLDPHANTARQWFRSPEVLALLPFDRPQAGHAHALVWSVPDARAEVLLALDDVAFADALAAATGQPPGHYALASPRASWPLHARRARRACGPGWVLLGDAAHVVHPLAGQGLNLGFADVVSLAEVLAAREPWRSPGDERLLRRHVRRRAVPIAAMLRTTDGLQRLFAHESAWLREVRNNGMSLVDHLRPVKRWLAARALDRPAPAAPSTSPSSTPPTPASPRVP